MKNLKNKLKKKSGFTLIEMLIVVAIIAVLVAVSIPLMTGALDTAREQTDAANLRAAKAEGTITLLNEIADGTKKTKTEKWYYDAENGVLTKDAGGLDYGKSGTNKHILVTIDYDNNTVSADWNGTAAAGSED